MRSGWLWCLHSGASAPAVRIVVDVVGGTCTGRSAEGEAGDEQREVVLLLELKVRCVVGLLPRLEKGIGPL